MPSSSTPLPAPTRGLSLPYKDTYKGIYQRLCQRLQEVSLSPFTLFFVSTQQHWDYGTNTNTKEIGLWNKYTNTHIKSTHTRARARTHTHPQQHWDDGTAANTRTHTGTHTRTHTSNPPPLPPTHTTALRPWRSSKATALGHSSFRRWPVTICENNQNFCFPNSAGAQQFQTLAGRK